MPHEKKETWGFWESVSEVVRFTILAILIVVPIRIFIAQPYIVSGASMLPTFKNGDYLIVDQLSYRLEDPRRGDVVIFRFPKNPSKFFIKRVLGIPKDTIQIQDEVLTLINKKHPSGVLVSEPYQKGRLVDDFSITLAEDEYFVMGDNRNASLDSRIWGALNREFIVGRAFLRLFPLTDINYLPGKFEFEFSN